MKNRSRTILYFYNLVILTLYLLVPISCDSQASPYNPTENIALDCGSPVNDDTTSGERRKWVADTGTNSLSNWSSGISSGFPNGRSRVQASVEAVCVSIALPFKKKKKKKKTIASKAQRQSPQVSNVPYMTARISVSDFSYVFLVTAGQKFIRLHFYPSQYPPNFDPTKAFFSVKANQFTLLSNFSASLTATYLGSDYLVKEFCINIEDQDQTLNITFIPSSTPSDAYAFINGIEIVSMPTNLYYSSAQTQGVTFIGNEQNPVFRIENNTALETVHRLNVGGREISPRQDTGMFRHWLKDDDYVSNIGALPVNWAIKPIFTSDVPNYTAPAILYMTARSMGTNKTENKNYNLTWNLPVDSGFAYLVRLHFCEFQVEVTKQSDREFSIFIANQTAEPQADVIVWAGRNDVPVYRDYAVMMVSPGRERKQNLSIALHPNRDSRTVYSDAILNGLEVFKVSDYSGNLAGLNADPLSPPASPSTPQLPKTEKRKTTLVASVVGGVLSGVVALSVLRFLIFRRRKRVKESGSSHGGTSWWGSISYVATQFYKVGGSPLPSHQCRHFSFTEIKAATNNFNDATIIGRGGFGDVYKGYIDGGATQVAIKRLKQGSQQGVREFKTEIEMFSQLRHLHLVSLIGYCNDEREMILVYDYMSRGTLRDHLYATNNPPLSWKQRLEICIGAARGLHYLHAGAKHRVIHRDVKTTNILLDDKWVAKVSDFGLSKINTADVSNAHISTVVKGSIGYLDPEYYRRQQLTEKSDVYSFGVVLFEVLCARAPLNKALERDQVSLAMWACKCYQNGTLDQIIDPHLMEKIKPECLKRFVEIAARCLHDEGIKRPSMNDVVWTLEFALQLQLSEEVGIRIDGVDVGFKEKDHNRLIGPVAGDDENVSSSWVTVTSESGMSFTTYGSDKVSSSVVFSEIVNPKGH